jgi:hypothetical protein
MVVFFSFYRAFFIIQEFTMQNTVAEMQKKAPFAVKDCAIITIATGIRVQNLKEFAVALKGAIITIATGIRVQNLKEFAVALKEVPLGSIYHHFWGRLLRPLFDEPEYNNDFASWASRGLHDKPLRQTLGRRAQYGHSHRL